MKSYIKAKLILFKKKLLLLCSFNIFFTKLYFFIFSNSYNHEQRAVLNGIRQFRLSTEKQKTSIALLRRNIHRLEKGLIMRPRKEVFATSFIFETVQLFEVLASEAGKSIQVLDWSYSVLSEYFSAVDIKQPTIGKSFELFRHLGYQADKQSLSVFPYAKKSNSVSYKELLSLANNRNSVRWFVTNSAPCECDVSKAVELALKAPSACNRQSFEYIFITETELLMKVLSLAGGAVGFREGIPSLMVVVGDYSGYLLERDRHLIYIDSSLATMQLLLAFETLAYNSCVLNWPENDINNYKVNKLLNLPSYKKVIMLIAVGKGEQGSGIPFSQKKTSNDSLSVYR
ncbi:nitroreductase family protein [Bizionia paragorgiae]|uniref:nitroreductase family protein n=1 Tax=Bizionia paragorgiae TaxID=283786 RepID=UPI00299E1A31|nr:nitroreductase family protein [Bizionia paragorgiae]MDX1272780.1 nitroreductase family protein [Bizionia paragorgiae]